MHALRPRASLSHHRLAGPYRHTLARRHLSLPCARNPARLAVPRPDQTTSSRQVLKQHLHTSSPALSSHTTMSTQTSSAQDLAQQIQSHHSSVADASALANTASFLQSLSSSSSSKSALSFDPSTLLLRPVFSNSLSQPTDDGGDANRELQTLTKLAADSQQRAFAESYSSALVGEGNEADDMSDVAFWVPAPGDGEDPAPDSHADAILRALGLEGVGEASEPQPAKLVVPDGLRLTITGLEDSRVIVLEGRRVAGGWAGLIGVGVWS